MTDKLKKNSSIKDLIECLQTIVKTLFLCVVIIIIAFFIAANSVTEVKKVKEVPDDTIEYYLIGVLIDKNKYLEQQYPTNYKINLKLGVLYEIHRDFDLAESEYKYALAKAPYYESKPAYRLALFYIKRKKYQMAEDIMNAISERPDKKLIEQKGEIFETLGDRYYNLGQYETSIEKYNKAIGYYKKINHKDIQQLRYNIASAYNYATDAYLENDQLETALMALKNAEKIVPDSPFLNYKLAILTSSTSPDEAYSYFQKVMKSMPQIINPQIYIKFLEDTSTYKYLQGKDTEGDLYKQRIKSYEHFKYINLLYPEDFQLSVTNKKALLDKTDLNFALEMLIKNTSEKSLKKLVIRTTFSEKDNVIAEDKKNIFEEKYLPKGEISPLINISSSFKYITPADAKLKEKGIVVNESPITVDVYLYKNEKYQLKVTSFVLNKEKV